MLKYMLSVLVLTASFSAYAQGAMPGAPKNRDEIMFRDWISTSENLKAIGIDPIKADWNVINPLCIGQKKISEVALNKCKYEKARDSLYHAAEKKQCYSSAAVAFPDLLAQGRRTEVIKITDPDGSVRNVERIIDPISKKNLKSLRYNAMVECMQAQGWVDADNWKLGRRTITLSPEL